MDDNRIGKVGIPCLPFVHCQALTVSTPSIIADGLIPKVWVTVPLPSPQRIKPSLLRFFFQLSVFYWIHFAWFQSSIMFECGLTLDMVMTIFWIQPSAIWKFLSWGKRQETAIQWEFLLKCYLVWSLKRMNRNLVRISTEEDEFYHSPGLNARNPSLYVYVYVYIHKRNC
jgi:hypothetical protein